MTLTNSLVQKEYQAIAEIQARQRHDEEVEQIKAKGYDEFRSTIRQQFQAQQN